MTLLVDSRCVVAIEFVNGEKIRLKGVEMDAVVKELAEADGKFVRLETEQGTNWINPAHVARVYVPPSGRAQFM